MILKWLLHDFEERMMWAAYDELKLMGLPREFEGTLTITIRLRYEPIRGAGSENPDD